MSDKRLRRSVNKVILSGEYPVFGKRLSELGYHVILTKPLPQLISYERYHADMQCLIFDDHAFVLRECTSLAETLSEYYHVVLADENIDGKYPDNVRLNAAVVGNTIVANLKALDKKVMTYAEKAGYQLIHVNQGYAKCSTTVVSDRAVITADNGIYNSFKEAKIDVLKIRQGRVKLSGAEYGFIGGTSGLDINNGKRTLYFAGCIERHPDYDDIKMFCDQHQTEIVSLTEDNLTDIGGIIFC